MGFVVAQYHYRLAGKLVGQVVARISEATGSANKHPLLEEDGF